MFLPHDLRFALRTLVQKPGFTLVVIFTLALGIGASTIIFDFVNLFSWRRPPVERPRELLEVYTVSRHAFVGPYGLTSFADYEDYRDTTQAFSGLAAYHSSSDALDTGESTEQVQTWSVTGNFFAVVAVRAALGRTLTADDDRPGRPPAVVLGYDLWQRLGADVDVLGRPVHLAGLSVTVVGIAEKGFRGLTSGDRVGVFYPSHLTPKVEDPNADWFTDRTRQSWSLLGRLAPGQSVSRAQAELDIEAARLHREHPIPDLERRVTVKESTFGHPIDQRNLRPTIRLFGAAVVLLVLIVCANVANLQLSRATARYREMGIRQSLGAGRRRLMRQLMTESLLLALAGGLCGLLLALQARKLMAVYFGAAFAADMRFDHRVLGLTLLVSVAVTLLFGLAPAFVTTRIDLVTALKDAGASPGRRRLAAGPLLATAQVALALVLLACSAMLVKSLWQFKNADLGFDPRGLHLAQLDLTPGHYSRAEGRQFFRRFEERVTALPGVRCAGFGLLVPPVFLDVSTRFHLPEDPETKRSSRFDYVDTAYFETLGLPLLRGRLFEPQDAVPFAAESHEAGPGHGVVVVNRTLAEDLWPDSSAIGQRIRLERPKADDPGVEYEVVGVVGSVRQNRWSVEPDPVVYFSWEQRYRPILNLVVRADGDSAGVFAALREELRSLAPGLTLIETRTHDEYRWYSLVEHRLQTQTLTLFALAGFVLALLGVFGVMSYTVSRQVREIGIRMAVGASRGDLLGQVLRRGLGLALWGIGLGVVGVFWAVRLLEGMLAQAERVDLAVVALTATVLLSASMAAVFFPARRAAGTDPLVALRHE